MKVYIAGKITNNPDYKEHFSQANKMLTENGHLVMDPSVLPEKFPWDSYMPICYAMLDACEAIYMLRNWRDSRGAQLELGYAKSKGLSVSYELDEAPCMSCGNAHDTLCARCDTQARQEGIRVYYAPVFV